jgi:hypothetical protein
MRRQRQSRLGTHAAVAHRSRRLGDRLGHPAQGLCELDAADRAEGPAGRTTSVSHVAGRAGWPRWEAARGHRVAAGPRGWPRCRGAGLPRRAATPSVTTTARNGSQPDDGARTTDEGGLLTRGGPGHASACYARKEKRNQRREREEEGAHLALAMTAGTTRCSNEGMCDVSGEST